jgi:hypothetical protein
MPRRYVVSKLAPKAPELPKEVVRTAPRAYRDRWGTDYVVIWNDQPGDPLIGEIGRTLEASS